MRVNRSILQSKSSTGAVSGGFYAETPRQRWCFSALCGRHFFRNGGGLDAANVV